MSNILRKLYCVCVKRRFKRLMSEMSNETEKNKKKYSEVFAKKNEKNLMLNCTEEEEEDGEEDEENGELRQVDIESQRCYNKTKKTKHIIKDKSKFFFYNHYTLTTKTTKASQLPQLILSFLFCFFFAFLNAFVVVVVHDRTPNRTIHPPLPDLLHSSIPYKDWAFKASEFNVILMAFLFLILLSFHAHRVIVLKRMLLIYGVVMMLRCPCLLFTSLPISSSYMTCDPMLNDGWWPKVRRALRVYSRLGMSSQGVQTCGDFMYSGHSVLLTLFNYMLIEYTPFRFLHIISWAIAISGMSFIVAGHAHYTIDVIVAFIITTLYFRYYHATVHSHDLNDGGSGGNGSGGGSSSGGSSDDGDDDTNETDALSSKGCGCGGYCSCSGDGYNGFCGCGGSSCGGYCGNQCSLDENKKLNRDLSNNNFHNDYFMSNDDNYKGDKKEFKNINNNYSSNSLNKANITNITNNKNNINCKIKNNNINKIENLYYRYERKKPMVTTFKFKHGIEYISGRGARTGSRGIGGFSCNGRDCCGKLSSCCSRGFNCCGCCDCKMHKSISGRCFRNGILGVCNGRKTGVCFYCQEIINRGSGSCVRCGCSHCGRCGRCGSCGYIVKDAARKSKSVADKFWLKNEDNDDWKDGERDDYEGDDGEDDDFFKHSVTRSLSNNIGSETNNLNDIFRTGKNSSNKIIYGKEATKSLKKDGKNKYRKKTVYKSNFQQQHFQQQQQQHSQQQLFSLQQQQPYQQHQQQNSNQQNNNINCFQCCLHNLHSHIPSQLQKHNHVKDDKQNVNNTQQQYENSNTRSKKHYQHYNNYSFLTRLCLVNNKRTIFIPFFTFLEKTTAGQRTPHHFESPIYVLLRLTRKVKLKVIKVKGRII